VLVCLQRVHNLQIWVRDLGPPRNLQIWLGIWVLQGTPVADGRSPFSRGAGRTPTGLRAWHWNTERERVGECSLLVGPTQAGVTLAFLFTLCTVAAMSVCAGAIMQSMS
jgi:hypothetical protein